MGKAYAIRLGGQWKGMIQTPNGFWIELMLYQDTKASCEDYLRSCGFTVVERD